MTEKYAPDKIEKKWQDIWQDEKAFKTEIDASKEKFYALVEFPYPSGQGLHVGHPRPYTALDIIARKRRMQGQNVLFPMGFDAFGLPAENYAIKNKVHPKEITELNIKRFTKQLMSLGYSFDWDRVVSTTDPKYYKWTQWVFLKLFEKGLAYKTEMPINWCTVCKVGLANEEVVNGVCERCGGEVTRRVKSQWMLRITKYAERLLNDLSPLDYIERVKVGQQNWIGKSTGAEIDFKIAQSDDVLRVYTTRPDTIFGATYMVISPEHPLLDKYRDRIKNWNEVSHYREQAAKKSDFERAELVKEKTGVALNGITCVNPATDKEIPVWISDYVLIGYGTGAIMAVPAHDERDYEFALKFNLPIIEVVKGGDIEKEAYVDSEHGVMVNSGFLNGYSVDEAKIKITDFLTANSLGAAKVNYKLRDWVFSRQRYWGEPIPIIICPECGFVPLSESELPLTLPSVTNYETTDDGESPLAKITDWVNVKCPRCGRGAKRETDTMPQWAGSSWYFLRYTDPANDNALASKEALEYFMPVDWYNGGMEHTTLHMLYSRFWHKFLYDIGVVGTAEPYMKRTSHGMILGANNEKMAKSRGNVVNPDDIVNAYGADTLRVYEMFIGAFELAAAWSDEGVMGVRRFLDRVWRLYQITDKQAHGYSNDMKVAVHKTIKKVTNDYENMKFNTAIASLMTLVNEFYKKGSITRGEFETLLILLNPAAPHITEELYEALGNTKRVYQGSWPLYDEAQTKDDVTEIGVTVNGKVRAVVSVTADDDEETVKQKVHAIPAVCKATKGRLIVKEIYVKGRIYNIVMR